MNELPPRPNLRPVEIAKFLDLSLTKIYGMISEGKLPAFKIDGQYRISRAKFLAWYEKHQSGQDFLSV